MGGSEPVEMFLVGVDGGQGRQGKRGRPAFKCPPQVGWQVSFHPIRGLTSRPSLRACKHSYTLKPWPRCPSCFSASLTGSPKTTHQLEPNAFDQKKQIKSSSCSPSSLDPPMKSYKVPGHSTALQCLKAALEIQPVGYNHRASQGHAIV